MVDVSQDQALDGRIVLVAGAAGGLGSAAAVACAKAGATLVLLGRKLAPLNRLYDAVKAVGPEPILYPLDLEGASPDDFDQLGQAIDGEFGRLDGLLHCAAEFRGLTPLSHTDPADFARAIHVDLTARWWLTQACLPLLAKSEAGAAVFVLDDPARSGGAFWGGYGIAQAGQAALVRMLQAELGEHGPRISGLQPGPMRTNLRAKAYQANADLKARPAADYAGACVELLSPAGAAWRGTIRDVSSR
ncbi:SDR family NAD(P)-dependent oxidoreductase [Thermomonas sp. XSG]|jgi:NAD(P)-dependent dehydrogenase (short-subunit alcohol dehydrogenase family)|uniref:SDR family NAD(P)-dependent oxidoreductase n=1 Tax=Thermomonas sp. XSG TaxID=2771436 RepID=UPI001680A122|nr:SDR family NAD(P)-dependent oxidoreductase [Thermomonas sp. XSG]QNU14272.1 SDR family NAD(P)-dependent oxidoreductase [Thermomonas sp. XSG]